MNDDAVRRRARMDAEAEFIRSRGQRWLGAYVSPFYLKWMNYGASRAQARDLVPQVRQRAAELSFEDISTMVGMQWRVQVMGAWYAIARADEAFAHPIHAAFSVCYGRLTAPALTTAVLTYRGPTTAAVLRAYRDRDIANEYGAADFVTAALSRVDAGPGAPGLTEEDAVLDELLETARRLQRRTDEEPLPAD